MKFLPLFLLALLSVSPLLLASAAQVVPTIAPVPTSLSQSFGIGGGAYSSHGNYVLNDNGTALQNFATTVSPSVYMAGVSSAANSWNYSIQMNAFNPTGYGADTMQYVVWVSWTGAGNLFVSLDIQYYLGGSASGAKYSNGPVGINIAESAFKDAAVTISTVTLANGDVSSASASLKLANGTGKSIASLSIPAADQFPAVAYETDIVGFASGTTATFTQGSGTISYSSSGAMGFSKAVGPVGLSYTASKADYGTNEGSNLGYGSLSSTAQTSTSVSTTSQTLQTYTTPLALSFARTFNSPFHIEQPPINPTFFPNGTIVIPNGPSIQLKWSFAVIPLQTPTSYQANSTYAVYSAKGPGPNCFVNFGYKQSGNVLLASIFGTAAAPCANSTFSIMLKQYGSSLQSFNSTGGTTGTICHVQVASIDWNWCTASLTSVTLSYNAGTIQLKNTGSTWGFVDPISIDGQAQCTSASGTTTSCTASLTTADANDVLYCWIGASNLVVADAITVSSVTTAGLTWISRGSLGYAGDNSGYNLIASYYAIKAGTGVSSIAVTVTNAAVTNILSVNCIGIAGAATSSPFDPNGDIPTFSKLTSPAKTISQTISTTNPNDIILTQLFTVNGGGAAGTMTQPSGFTKTSGRATTAQNPAYDIVSSALSSSTITWSQTNANSLMGMETDALCSAAGCFSGTVTETITITTLPSGAASATITLVNCGYSNGTLTADGYGHKYTGVTASCATTLRNAAAMTNSRYVFNISPHPTSSRNVNFTTAASGTGSYSNSTYYQLNNEFCVTPQTPTTWDGAYNVYAIGTYLGASNQNSQLEVTVQGGGQLCDSVVWNDYHTSVSNTNPIGNTWVAQGNNSFTDTTGGHVHNVNYIQSSGGTTITQPANFDWLLLIPFMLIPTVLLLKKKVRF